MVRNTGSGRRGGAATRTRRLFVGGVAVLGALLVASPDAFAHATFQPGDPVPPSSDRSLTMHVPVERQDSYNTKIIVEVPEGFEVKGCTEKAEWSCATAPRPGSSATLVRWERKGGTGDPDDLFVFATRTPGPGSYPFPVHQFYANGDVVDWADAPGSDFPAPVLEVR